MKLDSTSRLRHAFRIMLVINCVHPSCFLWINLLYSSLYHIARVPTVRSFGISGWNQNRETQQRVRQIVVEPAHLGLE